MNEVLLLLENLNLDWSIAINSLPLLLGGIKWTIIIAAVGLFFGFIINL